MFKARKLRLHNAVFFFCCIIDAKMVGCYGHRKRPAGVDICSAANMFVLWLFNFLVHETLVISILKVQMSLLIVLRVIVQDSYVLMWASIASTLGHTDYPYHL